MGVNRRNLLALVRQLFLEKQYDGVLLLFRPDRVENVNEIKHITSDLIEIILPLMTDENYKDQLELYSSCEELLKIIATHAGAEEVLFEMLQIVEENQSENVFTSALKALQICLLRLKADKSRALEWTLNSIVNRITEMKIPGYLVSGYGQRQEKLLEQDDEVLKVLTNYIILALFYEPLLEDVLKDEVDERIESKITNRRNVLCCFFLQLLGKPLCYLDLTHNERKTNTYTMQCATSLVKAANKILVNPFYLLSLVEEKVSNKSNGDSVNENEHGEAVIPDNIYKMEEKLPIESMGIYYYLLIVEGIGMDLAPKVYCPLYIFHSCLYLVTDFLLRQAPALQWRGLLLCHATIDNIEFLQIPDKNVEEPIHQNFCRVLCQIIGYSGVRRHRQSGITLLKKYILRFSDECKYEILKTLIADVKHAGLQGYLTTLYKDLVAEKLKSGNPLPPVFCGVMFDDFLMKNMCVLKNGVETDLIEEADRIVPALNAVRFFALTDEPNATGFWNLNKSIEKEFLDPLRLAINISVAYYQIELQAVKNQRGTDNDYAKIAEMLSISALNGSDASLSLDPKKKLEVLNQSLTTLDLLKCLLARATECVEKRNLNKCTTNEIKSI